MTSMRTLGLVSVLQTLAGSTLPGQSIHLAAPNGRLREEFSDIRGVRELADGRVLVSDYIDQRVVLVNFETGSVTAQVTKGSGPREARLPTRLIPMAGDSTLVVDLGNSRLLLLDHQGRAVRTIPVATESMLGVRGIDAVGSTSRCRAGPSAGESFRMIRSGSSNGIPGPEP